MMLCIVPLFTVPRPTTTTTTTTTTTNTTPPSPTRWIFLNNSEMLKAVIVELCSSQNITETFLPNLVFLTRTCLQKKENCHNSITSNDIDMKVGPVTKLNKQDTATLKKKIMTSCQQLVTSLSIFQFIGNLDQLGRWYLKLTFSLTVILSYKN